MEDISKLKGIIEKGAEIGGSVSGALLGLAVAGPVGVIGGAALGPLIAEVFHKVGIEISEKYLGIRETIRVGATYSLAINKIEKEIKDGKTPRSDDFYKSKNGDRSNAETILEGTLLKARNEYEEKKIKYYSNFLANLNLNESISFEKGNTLLKIIEQLSYRQLVVLAYFETIESLNLNNWMISFTRKEELGINQDFYSELMDLYNRQLLQQAGNGISMSITALKISPFGTTMYWLLNLNEINIDESNSIQETINEINKYI